MKARRRFFYRRDCVGDGVSARGIWFLCVKTESVESWGEIQATNGFQWAEIRKHGHFGHNGNENNNNAVLLINPHIFFITCTFFPQLILYVLWHRAVIRTDILKCTFLLDNHSFSMYMLVESRCNWTYSLIFYHVIRTRLSSDEYKFWINMVFLSHKLKGADGSIYSVKFIEL